MSADHLTQWKAAAHDAWCWSPAVMASDSPDYGVEFREGAEWALAGMAVCAFLEDLALIYNAPCPECAGLAFNRISPWRYCDTVRCWRCVGTGKKRMTA